MKSFLWFDGPGGASGDMILAALVDLGVSPDRLNAALAALSLDGLRIEATACEQHGLRGTRVTVHTGESEHDHGHGHAHPHHRRLPEIRRLVEGSALPDPVKRRALAVFARLAEAEGRVHGIAPEEVHFHEVGALDSIADIVGACAALDILGVEDAGFSPLPLGHGTIHCAHGTLPNPGPATVELLKGFPVTHADEAAELVTPTGAALLTSWRTLDAIPDGAVLRGTGHGFGQRALKTRPNLLRVVRMEFPPQAAETDLCLVLETNIDDMSPELVGALVQKLMASGALDAFTAPIQMKKQRPAMLLTVLCPPGLREAMLDMIFTESTTFGVRECLMRRTVLDREHRPVQTPFGVVRLKIGIWKGQPVTASPEYEDCVKRAEEHGVPVRAVYEAAEAARHAASRVMG